MLVIAKRIWEYPLEHQITITAEWIPSHLNVVADWESRNVRDSSEWKLCPRIFQQICRRMGYPEVDIFASRVSHQLEKYYSWKEDPECLAADAFLQDWGPIFPFAFPPFCLISRMLSQAETQKVNKMVLVAPIWPTQPWYPQLLSMLIDTPLLLPQHPKLLSNPVGQTHPLLRNSSLNLAAWLVSGIDSKQRDFRRRLSASCSTLVGRERQRVMNQPGKTGVCGAVDGVWIPLDVRSMMA